MCVRDDVCVSVIFGCVGWLCMWRVRACTRKGEWVGICWFLWVRVGGGRGVIQVCVRAWTTIETGDAQKSVITLTSGRTPQATTPRAMSSGEDRSVTPHERRHEGAQGPLQRYRK